ncbi:cell division protein FtsA [Rhodospira trueperi]|uniref:Cell division protein FtsA n=1 Tax=Rhodospira trueperi TaxID=69960 RepID=A0A1G6YWR3_9PROT|nr:cell division protein FtsA [Rhodospira trueperi]SDD94944.1 cell division protein FtsA [Rhodospira trueperi]
MLMLTRTDRDRHSDAPPPAWRRRGGLIAALDVGTTKVACFIARADESGGGLRVLGVGHHQSRGVRSGRVANLDEVATAIRKAVARAEDMAGEHIDGVVVAVSGGDPESRRIDVEMAVAGHQIRDADVRRILACGGQQPSDPDRELLHCIPVGYTIDGTDGVLDPRGMYGERLGARMHLVSAAAGPLRNLSTVIERCELDVDSRVAAPYAAGLASLVEDERDLGATVIDMGGGTTSVGVFLGGHVIHVGVIGVGGGHVTNDIAQGLSTPLAMAERLKTMYGATLTSPADAREILRVPLVGEDEDQPALEIPRSYLVQVIRPRVEETLELVRAHLAAAGVDRIAGRRAVLTGGASQLPGVRELAEHILDKQVRPGRPLRLHNLADSAAGPAFATCAGLLSHAVQDHVERPILDEPPRSGGLFAPVHRIGRWLRENF